MQARATIGCLCCRLQLAQLLLAVCPFPFWKMQGGLQQVAERP
jgi:hypothetical protein